MELKWTPKLEKTHVNWNGDHFRRYVPVLHTHNRHTIYLRLPRVRAQIRNELPSSENPKNETKCLFLREEWKKIRNQCRIQMRNEVESERKKKEVKKSPKRASLSLLCDRSYNYGTQCAHTRISSCTYRTDTRHWNWKNERDSRASHLKKHWRFYLHLQSSFNVYFVCSPRRRRRLWLRQQRRRRVKHFTIYFRCRTQNLREKSISQTITMSCIRIHTGILSTAHGSGRHERYLCIGRW